MINNRLQLQLTTRRPCWHRVWRVLKKSKHLTPNSNDGDPVTERTHPVIRCVSVCVKSSFARRASLVFSRHTVWRWYLKFPKKNTIKRSPHSTYLRVFRARMCCKKHSFYPTELSCEFVVNVDTTLSHVGERS